MKQIIIFLTFLNFAASQGMLAKGKQKLDEMEKTIRENAAKLNIKTPASFNGERQDLKKIGQLKRKTKEETKKNGKKKFVPTDTWASFGSIGNNVQITDKTDKYTESAGGNALKRRRNLLYSTSKGFSIL